MKRNIISLPRYHASPFSAFKLNAADLNANRFDTPVGYAFNSGCYGMQKVWADEMKKKDFDGISDALPTTNTRKGTPAHKGLVNRWAAELKLCKRPAKTKSGC